MSLAANSAVSAGKIAVVIPCYKVTRHIEAVVASIGPEVDRIYCVDDCCPEGSGDFIAERIVDDRVTVLRHEQNQGVGGAVMTGYKRAATDGAEVIVKIDGDGQMDASLLPLFVAPILRGEADYTKGNRFWDLTHIRQMPPLRRIGNLGLSFMAKASSGYWDLFDPTNGYTAISASVAARLPTQLISHRYFFETDVLFRLNVMRAVVVDVPMDARYGDEVSNLKIGQVLGEFAAKHVRNLGKRLVYNYFLRDLPIASFELLAAISLLGFGLTFGGYHWWQSGHSGEGAPLGTVMIATVAVVSGLQFLLAFLNFDIGNMPKRPLHPGLKPLKFGSGRQDRPADSQEQERGF
ncbi:glycosyltransferase family 2 protein [Pseudomonas sp. CGJS7]|uniref:glycosyltransferase family 2 protein n=1 Tax=Pseudomonas sp. CGJS7 TaxID=3109348 RepID=UPI003009CCAB